MINGRNKFNGSVMAAVLGVAAATFTVTYSAAAQLPAGTSGSSEPSQSSPDDALLNQANDALEGKAFLAAETTGNVRVEKGTDRRAAANAGQTAGREQAATARFAEGRGR